MKYLVSKIISTKKPGSFNIYLNNVYAFTLGSYTLSKFGISKNSLLTANSTCEILECEITERLKSKLLLFLSARPRSEKEILQKISLILKSKFSVFPIFSEISSQKIFELGSREAINFLKKYSYIDDVSFAKYLMEQRKNQGKGPIYIKQDLYRKGISKEIIQAVLADKSFDQPFEKSYKKALEKYKKESDIQKRKQKIIRYLLLRGFSFEKIQNYISSL